MTNANNYAVIMAGGVGTRLWPFSRQNYPKQFHDILGTGKSLLQQTISRFEGVCPSENVYIVTNEIYYGLVKEQLPHLSDEQILLEPVKRNTAPCIAYAGFKIIRKNPEANLIVAPADQIILQEDRFRDIALKALEATDKQEIVVTLGIKPTRPDTGYGYIEYPEDDQSVVKQVSTFKEKPNLETAQKYLEQGNFVWNAGIFVWNGHMIQKAFESYMPEVAELFHQADQSYYTPQEKEIIKQVYANCPSESIDIGVMEKAGQENKVKVILCDFDWSDLGTWKSLYENSPQNENQNVVTGQVMTYDTQGCIIKLPSDKLAAIEGLDNYIVAEFDGVLLICRKDQEQKVKSFVADAKEKGDRFI